MFGLAAIFAALASAQADERVVRWHQDLETLSAGMRATGIRIAGGIASRGQKDFAILYPNFDRDIQAIETDVPKLADAEILLRLMRLMASAHVAHNRVETPPGMGFLNRLPVNFHWFADGLAVAAATPEYSETLGARVRKIGGLKPEEFLTSLEPYVSYENNTELREGTAELMNAKGILAHFRLTGSDGQVVLELEKPDGRVSEVSVPFELARTQMIGLAERISAPVPVYRSHPGLSYWYEFLPDSGTLFIQYNRCENDRKLPFAEFATKLLAEADAQRVKRVVIDLRWNGGGNSRVMGPLINGLSSRRKSIGPLFVLIGPSTFSSAVDNAVELRRVLAAKFVGETSGGMPGGYGEVARLTLPNSKLVIRYTTKNYGAGSAKTLTPDVDAPFTLGEFAGGRDPGLTAAIHAQ
jgi:hypothetical protein